MSSRISFEAEVKKFNKVMIITFLAIYTIYSILVLNIYNQYNDVFHIHRELNSYYENVTTAKDYLKKYIYSGKNEEYELFLNEIVQANKSVDYLYSKLPDPDQKIRIDHLRNMLTNFKKQANIAIESFIANSENYQLEINTFYNFSDIVISTSNQYYDMLVGNMAKVRNSIENTRNILILTLITFFLLFLAWIVVFTKKTTKDFVNPIKRIVKNINSIKEGKMEVLHFDNPIKEVEILNSNIDEMVRTMEENKQHQKERMELENRVLLIKNESLKKDELLAISELKRLQSQINPHFLFNTINMLYKLAQQEGAIETSELMEKTSRILRYGLDYLNVLSTLEKEIQSIKDYIDIQKRRFGDRINFVVDIQDPIANVQVPSMIIQPLIENAITHGLSETVFDGIINIDIYTEDNSLFICVLDNGKGISEDKLEELLIRDFKINNSYGLHNVIRRLKSVFCEKTKILVNSSIDCGFEVLIEIEMEESYV